MEIEKLMSNRNLHIHFVGVGGKSLNAVAKLSHDLGFKVSGSDRVKTTETKQLESLGIKVYYGKETFKGDVGLLVYSSALKENEPNRLKAKMNEIPEIKRSKFIGYLMRKYLSISVSGSHGKSTTSALLGLTLQNSGADPTVLCGEYVKEWESSQRTGKGKYLVVEACECDNSLNDMAGNISVITSIEKNHLEYYKNEKEIVDAFKSFVESHSPGSVIIANGDDLNVRKVIYNSKCKVITYGFNASSDYQIKDVTYGFNQTTFSVYRDNVVIVKDLKIQMPGSFNILNYAAVICICNYLGLPISSITNPSRSFLGTGKEMIIENKDTVIMRNVCKHPTQIKNFIDGIRQFYPEHKIFAVFSPNHPERAMKLLKEYGSSFKKADQVIVSGKYSDNLYSLKPKDIVLSIKKYSLKRDVFYKSKASEIIKRIKKVTSKKVVTVIGGKDVYKICDILRQA